MTPIILMLGLVSTLIAVSALTTSGAVYILLSNSTHRNVIPIISIVSLPAFIVVSATVFGHLNTGDIALPWANILGVFGITLTSLALIKSKGELYRSFFSREIIIPIISGLLSLAPLVYLNNTSSFSYNYLGNGEFLNYARLADSLIDRSNALTGFLALHQKLRYGQDVFLAVVAVFFNKAPIQLMHCVSAYLLFTYGAIVGLIIQSVFKRGLLTALLVLFHASMTLALYNYNASFFSSSIALPISVLILGYSASACLQIHKQGVAAPEAKSLLIGEAILLGVYIVFIALTYPEFGLPVIFASLGVAILVSLSLRRATRALMVIALSLFAAFLVNGVLIINAANTFISQLGSNGGWNILGDPKLNLSGFIFNSLGLTFPLSTQNTKGLTLLAFLILSIWGGVLWLALTRAVRPTAGAIIAIYAWLTIALGSHISPLLGHGLWYASGKFLAQFSIGFVIIMGVALMPLAQSLNKKIKYGAFLFLFFVVLSYSASNLYGVYLAKRNIRSFDFMAWKSALLHLENRIPLAVFNEGEGEVIWFAEIIANASQIPLATISTIQADRLERGPSKPITLHSGTKYNRSTLDHDFRDWPGSRFLAIIGAGENPCKVLKSTSGLTLEVESMKTVAVMGPFRIDRVEVSNEKRIGYFGGAWAISGVWRVLLKNVDREISVDFEVPSEILKNGPIQVLLNAGLNQSSIRIEKAGRHTLIVPTGNSPESPEVFVTLETLATWTPSDFDPKSSDHRKIGVKILGLNYNSVH